MSLHGVNSQWFIILPAKITVCSAIGDANGHPQTYMYAAFISIVSMQINNCVDPFILGQRWMRKVSLGVFVNQKAYEQRVDSRFEYLKKLNMENQATLKP